MFSERYFRQIRLLEKTAVSLRNLRKHWEETKRGSRIITNTPRRTGTISRENNRRNKKKNNPKNANRKDGNISISDSKNNRINYNRSQKPGSDKQLSSEGNRNNKKRNKTDFVKKENKPKKGGNPSKND